MSRAGSREHPCSQTERLAQKLRDLGCTNINTSPIPGENGRCLTTFNWPHPAVVGLSTVSRALSAALPESSPDLLTPLQISTAKAIVNLFETGQVLGDYGRVTLLQGDSGRLTFGRSQTTLGSGNLARLLAQYCATPGARFATRLRPHLNRIAEQSHDVDTDSQLHNLLRATADDSIMRVTQDRFFDQVYWQPALAASRRLGITSPLGVAVVYDSHVHGSWASIRRRTDQESGTVEKLGERAWVTAYVDKRKRWLSTHSTPILRSTTYRMKVFESLITQDQWSLELPLVVRSAEISAKSLNGNPPGCFDGPLPGMRAVGLASPILQGLDVRLLQLHLSDLGYEVLADGLFGRISERAVRNWQIKIGAPATGFASPEQCVMAAEAALGGEVAI